MHNYFNYISKFEVYLFSIKYKNFQCAKGVSIYCIILLFSDTHAAHILCFVFLVMYFATYSEKSIGLQSFLLLLHYRLFFNRPTLGIKMSVYEHMFTTKCCQRDVELYGD